MYGDNKIWGARIQAVMITFMICFNGGLGLSPAEAADGKYGAPHALPRQTLYRWKNHFDWFGETPHETMERTSGNVFPGKKGINFTVQQKIKQIIDDNPSLYLDEIRKKLHDAFGKWYSISSIQRCITKKIKYTLKLLTMKAVQADALERAVYKKALSTVKDPAMFVFLDESAVSKDDTRRRRGRSARGKPVFNYDIFTGDNQSSFTLLGAVDINGFVLDACKCVFRRRNENNDMTGTMDTERFLQWVIYALVPTLGNFERGEARSVVVMDNAPIHKDPRILAVIEEAGAVVVWCARYSPDLNPIEPCFNQYKSYLRRFAAAFAGMPWFLLHHFALKSVSKENMVNYYTGETMDGCISVAFMGKNGLVQTLIGAGILEINDDEEEPRRKKKRRLI